MHDEVRQFGPGECRLCGMDLVPLVADAASPGASASAATAAGDYSIRLATPPLLVGQRSEVELTMVDPSGSALPDTAFRVAHEKRIHLLIVDASLTDYHHEHPTPRGDGPALSFSFTPRKPGRYRVFADVIPEATRKHRYLVSDIPARTAGEPIGEREVALDANVDGLSFQLKLDAGIVKGKPTRGELLVRDAGGAIVSNLEPLMGAYAHLVGFSEDGVTVEHLHPHGPEPTKPTDRGRGQLKFGFAPTQVGLLRMFAQVKIDGRERFARFTLKVVA